MRNVVVKSGKNNFLHGKKIVFQQVQLFLFFLLSYFSHPYSTFLAVNITNKNTVKDGFKEKMKVEGEICPSSRIKYLFSPKINNYPPKNVKNRAKSE